MSALVNLSPDVPQDMEQEDVVELLNLPPDVPQDMAQQDHSKSVISPEPKIL